MASPEEFENAEQAKRIDAACDQFEDAWNSESPKRIEDFVADESAELRNQLLLHLVQLEIQLRNESNEAFQLSEYLDRFPEDQLIVSNAIGTPSIGVPETMLYGDETDTVERHPADRHLLFGLLALQNGLVSRENLVAAFARWTSDKSKTIDELLVDDNAISVANCELLKQLVEVHIQEHNGDPRNSLHVVAGSDLHGVTADLRNMNDGDISHSIAQLPDADPGRTKAFVPQQSRGAGRFRILRPLEGGKGGMGEISVAEDSELGRRVALKQIRSDQADRQAYRSKFQVEAEITGNLEHPGIVPIYSLGKDSSGRPFYAMRLVKGDNLGQAIEAFHSLRKENKASYGSVEFRGLIDRLIDVAQAISYAHSRGVLHRDLKPGNVLVGKYGETLVIDWGLARLPQIQSDEATNENSESIDQPSELKIRSGSQIDPTMHGSVMGTLGYAPPEQITGHVARIGNSSDVYGLGAILYQILTGVTTVQVRKRDTREVMDDIASGRIRSPEQYDKGIPKSLTAICLKSLSLYPSDRYQTADEFVVELERWKADQPVQARQESQIERTMRLARKHRSVALATVFAVMVVAVVAVASSILVYQQRGVAQLQKKEAQKERDEARRQKILAEEQRDEAVRQEAEVVRQKSVAEKQKEEAKRQAGKARAQRIIAEEQRDEATRLRQLAERRLYSNYVRSAQIEWLDGDERTAWSYLNECDAMYQGWEHRYLRSLFARTYKTISGAETVFFDRKLLDIKAYEWLEDGPGRSKLLTAHRDGTLNVLDVGTGETVLTCAGHTARARAVALSPDRSKIVSGSSDKTVKLWDAVTGELIFTFSGHTNPVVAVEFVGTGDRIVSGSNDGQIKLWDAKRGDELLTLSGHSKRITWQAVHADDEGNRIYSISEDETTIKIWDAHNGAQLMVLNYATDGTSSPQVFHNFKRIVFNGSGRNLWNIDTGKEIVLPDELRYVGYKEFMVSPRSSHVAVKYENEMAMIDADGNRLWEREGAVPLAFCPNESQILCKDDGLKVLDVVTGDTVSAFNEIKDVSSAKYQPNGRRFVCRLDGAVNLRDAATGELISSVTFRGVTDDRTAEFGTDATRVVSSNLTDDKLKIWNTVVEDCEVLDGGQYFALGPAGRQIAFSDGRVVTLWDLLTRKAVASYKTGDSINSVAFSPDGSTVAVGGSQLIELFDVSRHGELKPFRQLAVDLGRWAKTVTFNADGNRVATASDNSIIIWDTITGEQRLMIGQNGVRDCAFSRDGSKIIGWGSHSLKMFDAVSGLVLVSFPTDHISAAALSPDGSRVVSARWSGRGEGYYRMQVWDVSTAKELITLKGHSGNGNGDASVTFSPDGSRIASTGRDGTLRIWDAFTCELLLKLERARSPVEFSADGRIIVASGTNGNLRVFDASGERSFYQKTFSTQSSASDEIAYHKHRAEVGEQAQDWFAAAFHLDRLIVMNPEDGSLRERRTNAELELRARKLAIPLPPLINKADSPLGKHPSTLSLSPH